MITTKSVGISPETADPKPVRGVGWAGQAMKEGDSYWGEVKPQPPSPPEKSVAQPRGRKTKGNPKAWSPEAREAYSKRMKAWWQAKKAKSTTTEGT